MNQARSRPGELCYQHSPASGVDQDSLDPSVQLHTVLCPCISGVISYS